MGLVSQSTCQLLAGLKMLLDISKVLHIYIYIYIYIYILFYTFSVKIELATQCSRRDESCSAVLRSIFVARQIKEACVVTTFGKANARDCGVACGIK